MKIIKKRKAQGEPVEDQAGRVIGAPVPCHIRDPLAYDAVLKALG